jgi:hypothetical protein
VDLAPSPKTAGSKKGILLSSYQNDFGNSDLCKRNIDNTGHGWRLGSGMWVYHADRGGTFGVASLRESSSLAGTTGTSRSPSTPYAFSVRCDFGRPAPIDHRKYNNNVMRGVCVGEEGDGEVIH